DAEEGKITVSRWPQVQKLLRALASSAILRAKVREIKDAGATVELAPGVEAWLPGSEASWARGRVELRTVLAIDQVIDVMLLPRLADDREDNIRVSRKRAWAREYLVTGSP